LGVHNIDEKGYIDCSVSVFVNGFKDSAGDIDQCDLESGILSSNQKQSSQIRGAGGIRRKFTDLFVFPQLCGNLLPYSHTAIRCIELHRADFEFVWEFAVFAHMDSAVFKDSVQKT